MTSDGPVDAETITAIAEAIAAADDVVALTGAGVSAASGVPPFRGESTGDGETVWERFDPIDFHRRRFDADPAGFWADRIALRDAMAADGVEPNAAHRALARLETGGHLDTLVTQNVDGLHEAAGSTEVLRLHGRRDRVECEGCGDRRPAEPVVERARNGERPPTCDCGGVYKPAVVLFGEPLPVDPFEGAQRRTRRCDLFLALGTSLSVRPASLLPDVAAERDATLVVCNLESTPVSAAATYDLRADVTDVLPRVADRVG